MDRAALDNARELIQRSHWHINKPRSLPEIFENYLALYAVKVVADKAFADGISDPQSGPLRKELAVDYSEEFAKAQAARFSSADAITRAMTPGRIERTVRRVAEKVVDLEPKTWAKLFGRASKLELAIKDNQYAIARVDRVNENLAVQDEQRAELAQMGVDADDGHQQGLRETAEWRRVLDDGIRKYSAEGQMAIFRGASLPDEVTERLGPTVTVAGTPGGEYAVTAFDQAVLIYADSETCKADVSLDTRAALETRSAQTTAALHASREGLGSFQDNLGSL